MMRARALAIAVTPGLLGCGSDEPDRAPEAPVPHVASSSCPLKTAAEWQQFRAQAVENEAWVRTCSDQDNCQELVGEFAERVQTELLDVLASCSEDLRDNPSIVACTSNLRRFAPAWLQQHAGDAYGFRQTNRDYLAAQLEPTVPSGMMDPPRALLEALRERASIEAAARENGWPYLTHDSCLGGARTFINVVDRDERFEQWLLVPAGPDDEPVGAGAILSFIGVQKQTAEGVTLPRVRLHFRDYVVADEPAGWQVELPEHYPGKCYACHGSGLRSLLPSTSTLTSSAPVQGESGYGDTTVAADFAERRLRELNQRLLGYGLPDWGDALELTAHGPPLGAELGCTHCHDGVTRGPLTVFTSEGMLYQKVVEQLSMRSYDGSSPVPDQPAMALLERERSGSPALDAQERAALAQVRARHEADYRALVGSRFATWKAWALDVSCQ